MATDVVEVAIVVTKPRIRRKSWPWGGAIWECGGIASGLTHSEAYVHWKVELERRRQSFNAFAVEKRMKEHWTFAFEGAA